MKSDSIFKTTIFIAILGIIAPVFGQSEYPVRDNLGDVVRSFDHPGGNQFGQAWDGELLWLISQTNPGDLAGYTKEGELRDTFSVQLPEGVPGGATGLAYDGEAFWTGGWPTSILIHFDRNGNVLGTLNPNAEDVICDVAYDSQTGSLWYTAYLGERVSVVRNCNLDGEILQTIDCSQLQYNSPLSLEWVPVHSNAPLWLLHSTDALYQCRIENGNAIPVQSLELRNEYSVGLAHDGENLWYTTPTQAICIDDGIPEQNEPAHLSISPIGLAVEVGANEELTTEITLANDSDVDVFFSTGLKNPPVEQRRAGPRRDEVDLDGLMFAVFQDTEGIWYWIDENMLDPILDRLDHGQQGSGFHSYRNPDDWNTVEFEQYDAIIIATARQSENFNRYYTENLVRLEEYIAAGGAVYIEMGFGDNPLRGPGGIRNQNMWGRDGRFVVSPNPEDENYSLLAEICHDSQPEYWEDGHEIRGGGGWDFTDSDFDIEQFENNEDIPWYQVIAVKVDDNAPAAVAYGIGEGAVLIFGGGTGKAWAVQRDPGQWGSIAAEVLFYLTEMSGQSWVSVTPEDGVIAAHDSNVLNIDFTPEDMDAGVYEMRMNVLYASEEDTVGESTEFSLVMSLESSTATLNGIVLDAETNEPVSGAEITIDKYLMKRISDVQGQFRIENLPLGLYRLDIESENYLTLSQDVNLENPGECDLTFVMPYAELSLELDSVETSLRPGDSTRIDIVASNIGNGPLTYSVERRLIGDANAAPWELRSETNIAQILEDDRIEGIAFDGNNFYYAGANGNEPNTIYVVDRENRLLREFIQPGESRYGMKDLEWDGELLWGSGEERIFGFDTLGNIVHEFQSGLNSATNIAYDSDQGFLWISSTTSNIASMTRDGVDTGIILPRKGLRIYGLAYWPDDPDGFPLYILNSVEVGLMAVHKMNTTTGDTIRVKDMALLEGASVGSAFICNTFDVYSWVMMTINSIPVNAGSDKALIYQLDARKEWFVIDPTQGTMQAGESQTFGLTLNASGLPIALFEGQLVFNHDGIGRTTILPIRLNVIEETGVATEDETPPSSTFGLIATYPNPFNSQMTTTFDLPQSAQVKIKLYDLAGRVVQDVLSERVEAGRHILVMNGDNLANGLYILRLESGVMNSQVKVMLLK